MTDDLASLDAAIRRSSERGSYYWAFLSRRGKARRREHLIEVRIDLPCEGVDNFVAPPGWEGAHSDRDQGMVFLRRRHSLRDKDLRALFAEVLALAFERGGRFHSWTHDPLPEWPQKVRSSASA